MPSNDPYDTHVCSLPNKYIDVNENEIVYLGGGDGDLDLTAVGAHQGTVGVNDLDGIVETTVLGQGIEEVLGQVVVLAGSEQLLNTSLLLDTVDGGVLEELTELGVLLDNALDSLQVGLDGIQSLLLGGSGVEGSGVATLDSVEDSGDLFFCW